MKLDDLPYVACHTRIVPMQCPTRTSSLHRQELKLSLILNIQKAAQQDQYKMCNVLSAHKTLGSQIACN